MKQTGSLFFLVILMFVTTNVSCSSSKNIANKTEYVHFRMMTYNVRNCKGMDNVTDFDRVAAVITNAKADYVAIQELDSATHRSNGVSVLTELANRTNLYPIFRGSIDYQGGKYGIGFLTREKPISTKSYNLPGREEKRSLLMVEMENCLLCCTHFSLNKEDRLASIALIDSIIRAYGSKPVVLAGDLNAVPISDEIKLLNEKWQILNDTSAHTFPSDKPDRCIDYILFRKNPYFEVKTLRVQVQDEQVASDHRPVIVEMSVIR